MNNQLQLCSSSSSLWVMVTNFSSWWGASSSSYEPVSLHRDPSPVSGNHHYGSSSRWRYCATLLIAVISTALLVHRIDQRTVMLGASNNNTSNKKNFSSVLVSSQQQQQHPHRHYNDSNHSSSSPEPTTSQQSSSLIIQQVVTSNDPARPQHDPPAWPRLAWLMSFPNSGTTFTSDMVRLTTNTTTATNYGLETSKDHEDNVPVFESNTAAPPWWMYPNQRKPDSYVLTKTHCGGRCPYCPPSKYIETTRSFHVACRSGSRRRNGTKKEPMTYYSTDDDVVVHRAIHLIRNPFDNLVARLHMERKNWEAGGGATTRNKDKLTNFTSDKSGLKAWCRYMDEKTMQQELKSRFIDDDLLEMQRKVPCHAEFYRYIQWHNQAIQVTKNKLQVPVYYLYYENYTENFGETVSQVLDFLQLKELHPPPNFIAGREYHEYFEPEERRLVAKLVKALSSIETWNYIRHYVEHHL